MPNAGYEKELFSLYRCPQQLKEPHLIVMDTKLLFLATTRSECIIFLELRVILWTSAVVAKFFTRRRILQSRWRSFSRQEQTMLDDYKAKHM